MGLKLNKGSPSTPSLGLSSRSIVDVVGKPDSSQFVDPGTLLGLDLSKKQNPPSVRGKKSIARNLSSSTSFSHAVLEPSQAFSSKRTSLSANTSFNPSYGPEPQKNSSFVFMASMVDELGYKSGWDGDRNPSGDNLQAQSKSHAHIEADQTKGEGSLGFEVGQARIFSD